MCIDGILCERGRIGAECTIERKISRLGYSISRLRSVKHRLVYWSRESGTNLGKWNMTGVRNIELKLTYIFHLNFFSIRIIIKLFNETLSFPIKKFARCIYIVFNRLLHILKVSYKTKVLLVSINSCKIYRSVCCNKSRKSRVKCLT